MPSDTETIERLTRIEGKVDTLLDSGKDQETRIRALERWRNTILGAGLVLSVGVGWALRNIKL